jgi:hypothetical protein
MPDMPWSRGGLIQHDLNEGLPLLSAPFHALLVPSSLYYLRRDAARTCLLQARELLVPAAPFYLRMRLPDDHRYGRGQLEGDNAWRLSCDYTGEAGALNVFWHQHEIVELLEETLGVSRARLTVLRVAYENVQGGNLIRNSDAVFLGRLP